MSVAALPEAENATPARVSADTPPSLAPYVRAETNGDRTLHLLVDGMHCAACQNRIERALRRIPGAVSGRVNLTTHRLALRWDPARADIVRILDAVESLGFKLVPYDPDALSGAADDTRKRLLRAMAVAGFAAANIMLLSVAVWSGAAQDMQPATRALMHWLSALIAIPAVAYAGRPFFRSAVAALASRSMNMDVPISVAVLLATGMSLAETLRGAEHVYFDSATGLLFFLLIGRFLEQSARGRARSAVEQLIALEAAAVMVVDSDGARRTVTPDAVRPGMRVTVPAGARIPVDGIVTDGESDVDVGLITGESVPATVDRGAAVHAGAVNLTAALTVEVAAAGRDTLLAEIARLLGAAEQRRARYVDIAARIVRVYAPTVHGLAALTFLGWLIAGAPWQTSLLNAIAVLIITCPCALALAVPVVQVVAANRLYRQGILVKSPTALERLARVDGVVFDKTGTLTEGQLEPVRDGSWTEADLKTAASLAAASLHPLARSIAAAAPAAPAAPGVVETPGQGLRLETPAGEVRLGRGAWCGADSSDGGSPELWLSRPGHAPVRFVMTDRAREDADAVVRSLEADGYSVALLSGDRKAAVAPLAASLGIGDWRADCTPADKISVLERSRESGSRICMVGDGLNDAPALAGAFASMSPSSAADISQTAADVVFQGDRLAPVAEALRVARGADRLVRQNFALAFCYNAVTVPLAMAGLVTPLIAAVSMSASSLVVIANALRLGWRRRR